MINKYAEINDRVLLYNACKGILRVKMAAADGMTLGNRLDAFTRGAGAAAVSSLAGIGGKAIKKQTDKFDDPTALGKGAIGAGNVLQIAGHTGDAVAGGAAADAIARGIGLKGGLRAGVGLTGAAANALAQEYLQNRALESGNLVDYAAPVALNALVGGLGGHHVVSTAAKL